VYKKIKPYIAITHKNGKKGHIKLPTSPSKALPARCHCPHTSYINGKIYMCGNAYSTGKRVGVSVPVCSIYDDWLEYFKTVDMFNQEVCKYCHANY